MELRLRWLVLFALLLAPLAAQGDDKFSLQAAFEPATAKPGDTVKLVLTATTAPGWHAYGTLETTNIPVALKAGNLQLGGLELLGEAQIPPGEPHQTLIGTSFPLPQTFKVVQPLKVPAGVGGAVTVRGKLDYQICDESMCERPATADFTATLAVAGGGGAAAAPAPVLGTKPPLTLEPDEKLTVVAAFEPATVKPGDTVKLVLTATTAAGWHAYGTLETTNIPVALRPENLRLGGLELAGEAQVPTGEPHQTLIGTSFPLPQTFKVVQPLKVPAGAAALVQVEGKLDYQVCDESMCERPTTAGFTAKLTVDGGVEVKPAPVPPVTVKQPVTAPSATQDPGALLEQRPVPGVEAPSVPDLGGELPGMDAPDEDLVIVVAFEPATAKAGEVVTLVLKCTVADGWHAYGTLERSNIPVAFDHAKQDFGALAPDGEAQIPPGELKMLFDMETYPLPQQFEVRQRLRVPAGAAPGEIAVKGALDYQVCDEGSCRDPAEAAWSAKLVVEAGDARGGAAAPVAPVADAPEDDDPMTGGWWALILASIGGGLFALAMPCTYPMIPITFSFFTKQAEKRHGSVLPLAIVYGLGIIAMFVFVGVGLSAVIQDVDNHWVTNTIIGVMFFFFAFVLFGWINLSPPQWMQRMAFKAQTSAQSGGQSGAAGVGGALLGVFFMGATLVITSFTCTAPIVGSLIAQVAKLGTLRVGVGMAVFGLTMALPFMVLALMPTKVKAMPKSGEWMDTLKISLGFVELAAAFKFVSMVDFYFGWQILPRELFLMLWTAIFGMWAMFLFGILRKAGTVNQGVSNGRMAGGMAVTLLATYFFYGALGYQVDFYTTNFIPGYSAQSVVARGGGGSGGGGEEGGKHVVGEHRIVLDDQPKALALAKAEDKLLLYNFTGFN